MKDRADTAESDADAGAAALGDVRSARSQHGFDIGPPDIALDGIVEYRRQRPTMPSFHTSSGTIFWYRYSTAVRPCASWL